MKRTMTSRLDPLDTFQPVVRDLMTNEVMTLTPEDSLRSLRDLLEAKRVRHVPITDEQGKLVGLITQRDFLTVAVSKFAHVDPSELDEIYGRIRIGEVMGKKVVTARPWMPLAEAANLMYQNKYGCLPVVEDKKLIGIVTEADFVKAIAQALRTNLAC